MIGTETLAQTIADAVIIEDEFDDVDMVHSIIPDGFTYLRSGGFRHAFLGPDNVVYKVPTMYCNRWGGISHQEENYLRGIELASKSREGFRVAQGGYFSSCDVMTQEYVDGERAEPNVFWDIAAEVCKVFGAVDINLGNFLVTATGVVLIDW